MELRPLSDYCIIKKIEEDDVSLGGVIIIPDTAKKKPDMGIIIAIGYGEFLENGTIREMEVTVGDTVFFKRYAGNEIRLLDDDHLVIREADILCIIEGPPKNIKKARWDVINLPKGSVIHSAKLVIRTEDKSLVDPVYDVTEEVQRIVDGNKGEG